MNNGLKALLIAAGIIITCIVAGLAFQNTREGKAQASSAFAQFNKTMSEYQDLGKSMYDGLLVSGAEVRRLIENSISSKEYVQVCVHTGDGVLQIDQLQLQGKKAMEADAFLRGCDLTGKKLG